MAARAGAEVRREKHQGKGYVVRRMFNDIEADVYVLVDGDATYDAPSAPAMIGMLTGDRLDMVVACRVDRDQGTYRPGHRAGNRMLTGFVTHIFGRAFTDILSGYRAFSRRFVKSFPILSGGFEIETTGTAANASTITNTTITGNRVRADAAGVSATPTVLVAGAAVRAEPHAITAAVRSAAARFAHPLLANPADDCRGGDSAFMVRRPPLRATGASAGQRGKRVAARTGRRRFHAASFSDGRR